MTGDLRDRIVEALRAAAFDCDGNCGKTETNCDAEHPIQVSALHFGQVASVYGSIEALADAVMPVVGPLEEELEQLRDGSFLYSKNAELHERADRAKAERDQARETNRRLNQRCQQTESKLATLERAVGEWTLSDRGTYVPLRSLAAIANAVGREIPEGRFELHYQRVERAEAGVARVREYVKTSDDDGVTTRETVLALLGGKTIAEIAAGRYDRMVNAPFAPSTVEALDRHLASGGATGLEPRRALSGWEALVDAAKETLLRDEAPPFRPMSPGEARGFYGPPASAEPPAGVCPTPCDPDCGEDCHEAHAPRWKRGHDPDACPGWRARRGWWGWLRWTLPAPDPTMDEIAQQAINDLGARGIRLVVPGLDTPPATARVSVHGVPGLPDFLWVSQRDDEGGGR